MAEAGVAPRLDYLMTLQAQLDPPQLIDESTRVVNVTGGWVKGPRISGKIIAPAGDWLRVLPSGGRRIDVRLSILTDDHQLIYTSYNGIIKHSVASAEKLARGDVVTPADGVYFAAAPTYHTSSQQYAWLNEVQTIAVMVEVQFGEERRYVKYDVFSVDARDLVWEGMMQVFRLADEQEFNPRRHVEKILGRVGDGDVAVACWEPEQISPYHCHPHATEVYFCFDGGGVMRTPNAAIAVTTGSFVVHPPGEVHEYANGVRRTLLFRVRYGSDLSTRTFEWRGNQEWRQKAEDAEYFLARPLG